MSGRPELGAESLSPEQALECHPRPSTPLIPSAIPDLVQGEGGDASLASPPVATPHWPRVSTTEVSWAKFWPQGPRLPR